MEVTFTWTSEGGKIHIYHSYLRNGEIQLVIMDTYRSDKRPVLYSHFMVTTQRRVFLFRSSQRPRQMGLKAIYLAFH